MNLGQMDRLISVQLPTTATDEYGSNGAITWTELAQFWAKMDTSISSESVSADKVENSHPVKWVMHYSAAIKTDMKIVYESKNYYIKGIREVVRRKLIEVQTELAE
jgi:head-tail adaptor